MYHKDLDAYSREIFISLNILVIILIAIIIWAVSYGLGGVCKQSGD